MFTSLLLAAAAASPDLTTVAERSGDLRTGRYDEVVALCADYERAFPGKAKCTRFGSTPEGRPMLAIVASDDGTLDPEAARKKRRPVLVFQGGIHAGEIDGKDAGFRVLREALRGKVAPGALRAVTVVFVPVFNVDGHERVSRWSRPNQRGPEEMGWRTTAQNLNLNRDYAKADAPEMQAMLALLRSWDPVLYVDLHVTDGAKFRHDVSITVEPSETPGAPLHDAARKLRGDVVSFLRTKGHLPVEFYPAFLVDDDPTTGFHVGVAPPRLSTPYWGWKDRMGLLVETHSWHTYPERVKATFHTLVAILERAREEAGRWQADVRAADASRKEIGGQRVALDFASGEGRETIEFLGYAYRREPSSLSGGTRIVFDETKPETWTVPLITEVKPKLTVTAPRAGYVIPPPYAPLFAEKLALHGFTTVPVKSARSGVAAEVFKASETKFEATSYESHQRVEVKGAWTRQTRDIPAGSLFVPVAQPGAHLLLHLMEPEAPDSLVAWGFLNACFEQKEYMESYVAEEIGQAMLRDDMALRAEFDRALADPAFAGDPKRRLDFFYKRSPYWDPAKDVVPILRVDAF
jgi:hypothetical protein